MSEGLVLQRVEKRFGDTVAVDTIDLSVAKGELTALLGPSGCGKTTLLRMIAGLEQPTRGRILLGGRDITAMPAEQRRFGMVFQSFALFPHMSVAENIGYSLKISGVAKGVRDVRIASLLDLVQLKGYGGRRIAMLSGGQRQRVAMARALAQDPSVILLDEPMSALDAKLREEMQIELRLLQQKLGITTIVVTHDQREAMTMADTIVVMSQGRCEQVGPPHEIYHAPKTRFVASFIGKANLMPATVTETGVALGGQELTLAEPAMFRQGTEVVMTCRPENIVLEPVGSAGSNAVDARIQFIRDVGPTKEVFLRLGEIGFTCEMPARDLGELHVGDLVAARLPAESIRLYPASERMH